MKKEFDTAAIVLDEPTRDFLSSLKSRRQAAGLTMRELAALLNISPANIVRYEAGGYKPSVKTLIKLAEYFSYDLSKSINYKLYHGKLRMKRLRKLFSKLDLTLSEMSALTGYSSRSVQDCLYMGAKATPQCIAAVVKVLEQKNALCKGGEDVSVIPTFSPDYLRTARKEKGLSVKELARLAEVSTKRIRNYEQGISEPCKEYWRRITAILAPRTKPEDTWTKSGEEFVYEPVKFKFKAGQCYSIRDSRNGNGAKYAHEVNPMNGFHCVFKYEGMSGGHHRFVEARGGWTRTFTDAQLIGKFIEEVTA